MAHTRLSIIGVDSGRQPLFKFKKIRACMWSRESRPRHLNTLIEFCNQRFNLHIRLMGN